MDRFFYVFGFCVLMGFSFLTYRGGRVSDFFFDPRFTRSGIGSVHHK